MILRLNMTSNIPIYVQIRNEIVMGIGRGELEVGQGLPTVRQLAQDVGINMMTVNKAYNILKTEGFIEIDRRHGARVNPLLDNSKEFEEKVQQQLELIIAESSLKGMDYNQFMSMCENIFKNMSGLRPAGSEG